MLKRFSDVVVGVVASIATLPVVVVLMIGSALSFRANPCFAQERVGRHGRRFLIRKVRSLPTGVGDSIDKYELANEHTSRFGTFIRRTHLDELPQLWSVVTGTMSLVGPRPEMPHLAERFSAAQRAAREPFRPGCIGLWQASEHNDGLMHEHPEYDLAYAANHRVALDLYIVWRTAIMELGGPRLRLADVPRWLLPNSYLERGGASPIEAVA